MSAAGGDVSTADVRQSALTGKADQPRSDLDGCVLWTFILCDWQTDDDE